ncbi:hypothetical protein C5167_050480 [Papaver somniferum]|uniref:RanBP2-type domain-containing protein n=1 Tax=Papaver somniferum TaxID=3469 RepID=A0A4Y7KSR0_PAPSO|nr:hypothetical protein C5167_050480 [Papaver somniferum]
MANCIGRGNPLNGSVYVCNLPDGTDENMLAEFFGTIGLLKKDKRTGRPKIWFYRDKVTNEPKGDATITYEDPHAAQAAVDWFNKKDFHGNIIEVYIAEAKNKDDVLYNSGQQMNLVEDPIVVGDFGGQEEDTTDVNGGEGRGRGRVDASGKPWQQDGDWSCPNTSCGNVNFAFRGVCNRCGSARPSGASGSSSAGGGRGRGRGADDSGGRGRPAGAPAGLFGPNDWACPMGRGVVVLMIQEVEDGLLVLQQVFLDQMIGLVQCKELAVKHLILCANINWAKRTKCNICNTNKPGHNEGGVRGGRAGGYKELDEEEIEETRRRRREAEQDDGELYDEFGNLKKKFRAKTQQAEAGQVLPGAGRAGWEKEMAEREAKTGQGIVMTGRAARVGNVMVTPALGIIVVAGAETGKETWKRGVKTGTEIDSEITIMTGAGNMDTSVTEIGTGTVTEIGSTGFTHNTLFFLCGLDCCVLLVPR